MSSLTDSLHKRVFEPSLGECFLYEAEAVAKNPLIDSRVWREMNGFDQPLFEKPSSSCLVTAIHTLRLIFMENPSDMQPVIIKNRRKDFIVLRTDANRTFRIQHMIGKQD